MKENESVLYQDIPQNKLQAKVLSNWNAHDIYVLLLVVLIVASGWIWAGVYVAFFAAAFLLPFLIRFPGGYGRIYSELASEFRGIYRTSVLREIWWESDSTAKWPLKRLRRRRPIPLQFSQIQAEIRGVRERFGLIQQTDRPFDHLFITADGGDFVNTDINRQTQAVNELANITNQVILQTELKVGISYLRMTSPYNGVELATDLQNSMNPVIFDPSRFKLDSKTEAWAQWMHENAELLRPTATAMGGSSAHYLIVLTIKRSRILSRRRHRGLTDRQLYELPIIELGRSLEDALSSSPLLGLRNVHCLGLAELARVVRTSWDVTNLADYQRLTLEGKVAVTDEDIDHERKLKGDGAVDTFLRAWPERMIRTSSEHNYIVFDNNFLSTLRVTRLPERVRSDQFMSVHFAPPQGTWTRTAMVGQSVSGDAETRQLIVGASALLNAESAFFSDRVVRNPKFARKQRELMEQTQMISANSVSQHFNMLVVVAASSEEELLSKRKRVQSALSARGFRCELVKGADRQRDAVISGMLGINRL